MTKIAKAITATLKDFGKKTTEAELLQDLLSQWDDEVDKCDLQDTREALFARAMEDLLEGGKVRVLSDNGKTRTVEYIKKNKRGSGGTADAYTEDFKELPATKKHSSSSSPSSSSAEAAQQQQYPEQPKATGNNTILLFYAYSLPVMNRDKHDKAISHCYNFLKNAGVTGRLRIGREGFNGTLTGSHASVRSFTAELQRWDPATFGKTDFKYVDDQPDNQLLPTLKVFPVSEIVTYGFGAEEAPLNMGGIHLKPREFHKALENKNSVVIDVRNFNETVIGKFQPPENGDHQKYLDPCMRRSTEFPEWVAENKESWKGKQVLMYCTAGVRCERASAFMRNKGVENVYQLDGGVHRYLEEFKEDGGYWKGKNYTFDKRFSHGAENAETISQCVYCDKAWDRYNSHQKCFTCKMEILLCNECQRVKPALKKSELFCPLCLPKN